MRNRQKDKPPETHLEPYQPNYSPLVEVPPAPHTPPPRQGVGLFGCTLGSISIIAISTLLLALIIGGMYLFSLYTVGNTTTNIFDSIASIFRPGPKVTQLDITQIILQVEQQAWLETVRQTQQIRVEASQPVSAPLIGSIDTRTVEYEAYVTVTAGVDLQLLTQESFTVDGSTLTVALPRAQLKDCILDLEASRYTEQDCNVGGVVPVGCGGLDEEVRTLALKTAASNDQSALLTDAFNQAAEQVRDLILQSPGVTEVVIQQSADPLPLVANAGTCIQPETPPTPMPTSTP